MARPGQACGRDWDRLRQHLQKLPTQNLGFISCPGGTRVKDRLGPAEIFECSLLVYEVDSIPKADRLGLWEKAGLPEPTVVMDSGGKSLHCWYRLAEPVSPEQGREARQRLSLAIDAVLPDGKTTDGSMHSCHQPARLAGGIHPKTGERSTLVKESGKVFALADLMVLCPELSESRATDRTETIWRAEPEDSDGDVDMPELPLAKPVPLTIALGVKSRQDIEQGVAEGGRRVRAWSLSQTLQCAERQLQELGQPFTGSAFELWQGFVERCGLDLESTVDGYWVDGDDIGEGDLSQTGLLCRLRQFAIDECGWDPNEWFRNPPQGGLLWRARQSTQLFLVEHLKRQLKEARGQAGLRDDSFLVAGKNIISQLEQGWEKIASIGRPADRAAARMKLSESLSVSPRQMDSLVRELLEESNEDNKRFSTFDSVMGHDFHCEPLVEKLIARGRLTLLGALGGSGKSTTCYEVAEAVTTGGKVFGELQAALGKVLIYQADEPPSDAHTKWERMGFQPDNDRLKIQWGFTPSMLPDLEREVEQGGYDLVIMDSLTTIYAGGDAKMNDAEIGLPLYHLNRLASRTGAGILLTHHLKKGDSKQRGKGKDQGAVATASQPTKSDFFGSAFILNAVSDALGMWEMGRDVSGDPMFGLVSLKGRSGLMSTGQVYQLQGSLETWRSTLKADAGEDSLAAARTVEEKVAAFLRMESGKWFTPTEIKDAVPEAKQGSFITNTRQLSNALAGLYSQRHVTRINRRRRSGAGRGKPPFEYVFSG